MGGWRLAPEAMLWRLTSELMQSVRSDVPFEDWLRAQELDGLFAYKEREQLAEVVRGVVQVIQLGLFR